MTGWNAGLLDRVTGVTLTTRKKPGFFAEELQWSPETMEAQIEAAGRALAAQA